VAAVVTSLQAELRHALEAQTVRVPTCIGGCWLWTGAHHRGYGVVRVAGRLWLAHRAAWVSEHGPIRDGCHVHHEVCGIGLCWRPSHLEALAPEEHTRRHAQWRRFGALAGSEAARLAVDLERLAHRRGRPLFTGAAA
jgi:HNH endonuclease